MSGEITITPGKTWSAGEKVTYAGLNLAARPVAKVAAGAITAAEIDAESISGAIGNIASARNNLADPLFLGPWLDASAAGRTITAAGGAAHNLPDWYVLPEAGEVAYARALATPSGTSGVWHAIKITGHATCSGSVRLGQQVPAARAAGLLGPVVASAWIKNDTEADLAAIVRVYGCSAEGDWTTAEVVAIGVAETIGDTEWKRVSVALDLADAACLAAGGAIEWEFSEGSLDSSTKYITFARPSLENGTAAGPWLAPEPGQRPPRLTLAGDSTVPTSVPPAVTDDWTAGHRLGDLWHDLGAGETYVCTAPDPAGAAVWARVVPADTQPAEALFRKLALDSAAAFNLPAGSWVTIPFDDTGVYCDAALDATMSSNELTVAAAGTYEVSAEFCARNTNGSAASSVAARLYRSGGTPGQLAAGDAAYLAAGNTCKLEVRWRGTLEAGDVIRLEGACSANTVAVLDAAVDLPGSGETWVAARLHIRKLA